MQIPGFCAERALYGSGRQFRATKSKLVNATSGGVTLAGTCTCTYPSGAAQRTSNRKVKLVLTYSRQTPRMPYKRSARNPDTFTLVSRC
jgi:hypothetical protein